MTKKEVYYLQSRHITEAWEALGKPEARTICECAVGPWSLLQRFDGLCDRAIFIEPDPKMAEAARGNYPWAEVFQLAISDHNGKANLRKLRGSSYIKGIKWSPAFKAFPNKARRAGKVSVRTVKFDTVDDGKIDILNLDCEGSEWFVLENMRSRPFLLQIELYAEHGYYDEITAWLIENNYELAGTWGNANFIYRRSIDPE